MPLNLLIFYLFISIFTSVVYGSQHYQLPSDTQIAREVEIPKRENFKLLINMTVITDHSSTQLSLNDIPLNLFSGILVLVGQLSHVYG